jgi:TP901-1 family phage major tail protein
MSIIKGSDLMVFIETSGGSFKSIAYATNHTLTVGTNSTEISTKDDGGGVWNSATVQKLNWSATTENLFSLDGEGANFDDLFAIMADRKEVKIKFSLDSVYANKPDVVPSGGWTPISTPQYTGSAFITDLSVNAPDGDNGSFSATFTGNGALVAS